MNRASKASPIPNSCAHVCSWECPTADEENFEHEWRCVCAFDRFLHLHCMLQPNPVCVQRSSSSTSLKQTLPGAQQARSGWEPWKRSPKNQAWFCWATASAPSSVSTSASDFASFAAAFLPATTTIRAHRRFPTCIPGERLWRAELTVLLTGRASHGQRSALCWEVLAERRDYPGVKDPCASGTTPFPPRPGWGPRRTRGHS